MTVRDLYGFLGNLSPKKVSEVMYFTSSIPSILGILVLAPTPIIINCPVIISSPFDLSLYITFISLFETNLAVALYTSTFF